MPSLVLLSSLLLASLPGRLNGATSYTFTTLAGIPETGSADGAASAAQFNFPLKAATDASGNIYIADTSNNLIRKITPAGVVSTLAGSAGNRGSGDGVGSVARFFSPSGVAVDGSGNVYVADAGNDTVRKITPAGVVTTLAGAAGVVGSADGTGSAATFSGPSGVAVDSAGFLYVADTNNSVIRKITPAGVVTTFAGTAGVIGSADGSGSAAGFNKPTGLTVDASGFVYVADTQNRTVRKITPAGGVTTLAGSPGVGSSIDGTGSLANFQTPSDIAVDISGSLYVADSIACKIRTITPEGEVTTLAGQGPNTISLDGTGTAAVFSNPTGVAIDPSGNVFVVDSNVSTIRKISAGAVVTTFAGTTHYGSADGTGSAAQFSNPSGVAVDSSSGFIYVADTTNDVIRKISPTGAVTIFAGQIGNPGLLDGTGTAARFQSPKGVAVDGSGNVYVADTINEVIRKITPDGAVTLFAGKPFQVGSADGTGTAAQFFLPYGLGVDLSGNVYVADGVNSTIRKITPAGVVTTLAGKAFNTGSADGTGSAAQFNFPTNVAVDAAGNVFVADANNSSIRKVTPLGVVTTLATQAVGSGIALDGSGNIYTTYGNSICKITPNGVLTTLAGSFLGSGSSDGAGSAAQFNGPWGIAMDALGNLYVADTNNHTIRKGIPALAAPHYGDFNGDGQTDILWENTVSGQRYMWLMNGTSYGAGADLGILPPEWRIAGTGDFNADGQTDILWEDTVTGDRGIWLMNGWTVIGWSDLGIMPTDWHIAGTGDFNQDGQTDILWENTVTGQRYMWVMNGTSYGAGADLGTLPPEWRIAGTGDFNGDGQTDILWEDTVTGDRGIWLMNGWTVIGWSDLGIVPTDWRIAGTGDFNGDGQLDIVWENKITGERGMWLMNGTTLSGWAELTSISLDWRIAP